MKQASTNSIHHSFNDTLKEMELDLEWLALIYEAKEMGISLNEIREFLLNPNMIIQKGP
ncbi:anti-repressor SinI family protein [Ferdinandcohnia sp. SAFN-114]|uniref:anti-repressor SinI family protein n=1 Tax=Ferdinandcohnia sp. SAFN-114 TaxID=3387275 RepID=UPI003F7DE4A4